MKNLFVISIMLALLTACTASNLSTPIEMTAMVSTVLPDVDGGGVGTGAIIPTPGPPTLIPTLASALSPIELKYRVLDQFPDFFFCDPDYYPIAREDEGVLAGQRFPAIQANADEFQTILNHNGLSGLTNFTDEQKLLVYREHKKLNAVFFELAGNAYRFQLQTGTEGQQGFVVTGTIDGKGSIDIQNQESAFPTCPICLVAGTRIDTPLGTILVENLRVGDLIWTVNLSGERVQGTILNTVRVIVPADHQVVHVVLSDGRELWASPGHPTADGREIGNLQVGDSLDGTGVVLLERIPYSGIATYDVLPSGATGFYWANGILMGSTLAKPLESVS